MKENLGHLFHIPISNPKCTELNGMDDSPSEVVEGVEVNVSISIFVSSKLDQRKSRCSSGPLEGYAPDTGTGLSTAFYTDVRIKLGQRVHA